MLHRITPSFARQPFMVAAFAAVWIIGFALAPSVRAQVDITSPSLPHAVDSTYPWGQWVYYPSSVSDNVLGLVNSWHSGDERSGNYFPHWIRIDFGTQRTVTKLNVLAYSVGDYALRLKDFRFEGSNDGSTYTPLHGGALQYANQHVWQSFVLSNTTGYRYYRLYGLNNWAANEQMIIEEWEMFEGAPPIPVEETSWGRLKFMLR